MKRLTRANLIIAVMTGFTFAGFASAITGTLAWYAYSTRITISLTGTAVRSSVQLELGIVDNDNYFSASEISTYNLTRVDESDGNSIVWNKSAAGLTSEMINAYLANSVYSTNELSPVTTLGRSGDDALDLYAAPECSSRSGEDRIHDDAKTKDYVQIPFAFKILNSQEYCVPHKEIWITDTVVAAERNLEKAIRVFVDNVNDNLAANNRYLFRPDSATNENPGATTVAGLLDLNGDGYYDYNATSRNEYLYGDIDVDGDLNYSAARVDPTGFIDENDTGDTSQLEEDKTTFYSRHYSNTKSPILTNVTYKTAAFETKKTVYPSINGEGDYTGGKPVSMTSGNVDSPIGESYTYIGYSTLTIFIEGWDHSIIDSVVGAQFYLGLQFEINKV